MPDTPPTVSAVDNAIRALVVGPDDHLVVWVGSVALKELDEMHDLIEKNWPTLKGRLVLLAGPRDVQPEMAVIKPKEATDAA